MLNMLRFSTPTKVNPPPVLIGLNDQDTQCSEQHQPCTMPVATGVRGRFSTKIQKQYLAAQRPTTIRPVSTRTVYQINTLTPRVTLNAKQATRGEWHTVLGEDKPTVALQIGIIQLVASHKQKPKYPKLVKIQTAVSHANTVTRAYPPNHCDPSRPLGSISEAVCLHKGE